MKLTLEKELEEIKVMADEQFIKWIITLPKKTKNVWFSIAAGDNKKLNA